MKNKELAFKLLNKQLENFTIYDADDYDYIAQATDEIWQRLEKTISFVKNKYYNVKEFNPYHQCQYLIFLYLCANTIFKNHGNKVVCDKIYSLYKMLSGCDIYYEVELPDIFALEHPVGSVLGRAKYNNYFRFMQGCTVGGNKGFYPKLGEYNLMFSGSKIIGNCTIGNHVIFSANAYVKDTEIPDNCIVFPSTIEKCGYFIKVMPKDKLNKIFDEFFIIK